RRCADGPLALASLGFSSRQGLVRDPALADPRWSVDNDPGHIRGEDGGLDSRHLLRAPDPGPGQSHLQKPTCDHWKCWGLSQPRISPLLGDLEGDIAPTGRLAVTR